jgi:hypothetical protein
MEVEVVASLKGVVFKDTIEVPALAADTGWAFWATGLLNSWGDSSKGINLVPALDVAQTAYFCKDR